MNDNYTRDCVKRLLVSLVSPYIVGCGVQTRVELEYIKGGKIYYETVDLSNLTLTHNNISNQYIDSVQFSFLDSISFKNDNPDKIIDYSTSIALHFGKKIDKYSPEYYSIATAYYTTKAMEYYEGLFDNVIDLNTQKEYKKINILYADISLLTTPNRYFFEKGEILSPSIFYHEVGHRAFWILESDLSLKFSGLTYVHMGLLEYFTVSLNNFPIVGEIVLPEKLIRNAEKDIKYPFSESLYLRNTFNLL